jgi:hypothetical protein
MFKRAQHEGRLRLAGQSRFAVATDRHQPQSGRQTDVSKYLQRGAFVVQQSFGYSKKYADHAVSATRTAYRALVAVDDHRFIRLRRVVSHVVSFVAWYGAQW